MPKVDGWSVLSSLKAEESLSEIPVIMHSVQDDRDLGFVLGATEYLVKPVERRKLVSIIRRHIRDAESHVTPNERQRLTGGVERVLAKCTLSRHRFLDEVRRIVSTLTRHVPSADVGKDADL